VELLLLCRAVIAEGVWCTFASVLRCRKQQAASISLDASQKKKRIREIRNQRRGGDDVVSPSCPFRHPGGSAAPRAWIRRACCSHPGLPRVTREPGTKTVQDPRRAKGRKLAAMNRNPQGAGKAGLCSDRKAWSSWLITYVLAQAG
jgi:hypothetical protein